MFLKIQNLHFFNNQKVNVFLNLTHPFFQMTSKILKSGPALRKLNTMHIATIQGGTKQSCNLEQYYYPKVPLPPHVFLYNLQLFNTMSQGRAQQSKVVNLEWYYYRKITTTPPAHKHHTTTICLSTIQSYSIHIATIQG